MNIISFLSLYLFAGTLAFLFVIEALDLKALRAKRGTPEAAEHVRNILKQGADPKAHIAYALLVMFLPAMLIAEFFYDWE